MKLCDVSSFFTDTGGGVRTYHLSKLAYFARHPEHEYVMVVPSDHQSVAALEGGRRYAVPGVPVASRGGYRQLVDPFGLRQVFEAERPDVVEVGSPYVDPWLVLAALSSPPGRGAAPTPRPVTVGLYHADFPDTYVSPAFAGLPSPVGRTAHALSTRYLRAVYGRLDAVCVASPAVQAKLAGYGLRRVVLVPLGVDPELFHPSRRSDALRKELGLGPRDQLLLYAGRFSAEKGIDTLLEALPHLLEAEPRLRVVLVGDGPRLPAVLRAVRGEPRARRLEYVADRERLAALVASSDLLVAPGPHETFGLAALEAMAAGVPVAGVGAGGTAELVAAAGAGGLFRRGDAEDLARCVLALLRGPLSELGARGRQHAVSSHGWEETFDGMVAAYEELLRARRGPRLELLPRSTRPVEWTAKLRPTGTPSVA